jgi:hypothetical protein
LPSFFLIPHVSIWINKGDPDFDELENSSDGHETAMVAPKNSKVSAVRQSKQTNASNPDANAHDLINAVSSSLSSLSFLLTDPEFNEDEDSGLNDMDGDTEIEGLAFYDSLPFAALVVLIVFTFFFFLN